MPMTILDRSWLPVARRLSIVLLAVALVGCARAEAVPDTLARACLEPAGDLGVLLRQGRDTLRARHHVHLSTADLATVVARRVGARTDLRCVPVIDSVIADFADLTSPRRR